MFVFPLACVCALSSLVAAPLPTAPMAGCLRPPVVAPVVDPFRQPACPWCAGNRGLEYDVAAGTEVRAAAAGTVTFAGSVAGVRYVVVEHADGLRATYGRLDSATVATGRRVATGQIVGRSGDGLFFGIRRGETYLDPAPLLGRLVERARLVPTDGSRPRRPPPAVLACAAG
ncbi:MAG: M23 family metallopeptidase [Actinomycetota bacterium]|nr:M23 family metallopeptidase [Acidimicrobiia bacterium]MDQ3470511.1 M23 family metallopeptidase [Actinomycetota bacterium]